MNRINSKLILKKFYLLVFLLYPCLIAFAFPPCTSVSSVVNALSHLFYTIQFSSSWVQKYSIVFWAQVRQYFNLVSMVVIIRS